MKYLVFYFETHEITSPAATFRAACDSLDEAKAWVESNPSDLERAEIAAFDGTRLTVAARAFVDTSSRDKVVQWETPTP